MSQHTPGPYFYEREEEARYCSSTGVKERSWIWHKVKSEKKHITAFLDTGFLPAGDEEAKANAHLIAAAPEMLKALEEVEEYIAENCGCEMDGERAVVCDLHLVGGPAEAVRFAIAKAKGEL